jgi:hypothetical protein
MNWWTRQSRTNAYFRDGHAESMLRAMANIRKQAKAFTKEDPLSRALESAKADEARLKEVSDLWTEGGEG